MDVISEIKQFEQHPDRAHFSSLQVNDFYKTLAGKAFKFEAIISSISKDANGNYDIYANTYAYTILHNPVAERDYLNWAPDLSFICEAPKEIFKFNPITDLIKGDRFHCEAIFINKISTEILVKLTLFKKIQFLEVEKEKEILEKKFNEAYQEHSVYAPQRQLQKKALDKIMIYSLIGAVIGVCLGLFWGSAEWDDDCGDGAERRRQRTVRHFGYWWV